MANQTHHKEHIQCKYYLISCSRLLNYVNATLFVIVIVIDSRLKCQSNQNKQSQLICKYIIPTAVYANRSK